MENKTFFHFIQLCCVLKCVNNAGKFVSKTFPFLKNIKRDFIERVRFYSNL